MLGIIGGGNMARAIISGLIHSNVEPQSIIVSDVAQANLDDLHSKYQVKVTQNNQELVDQANNILFAIKPQQLAAVCKPLKSNFHEKLIISILAGTQTERFYPYFGTEQPVIRVMPNLAARVQSSISVLYANSYASEDHKHYVERVFKGIGEVLWLKKEIDMHTVTALSGSGPSYFFYMMDNMVSAALDLGLEQETARTLAEMTCIGAGKVVQQERDSSIESMIQSVCSKGGTTEAAMAVLESHDVGEKIKLAVKSAHARSIKLDEEN